MSQLKHQHMLPSRLMTKPTLTSFWLFLPRMTVMVFSRDLLNMWELILNRLLKCFTSAKKWTSSSSIATKLLLKPWLLSSQKFKVDNSNPSSSQPQSLSQTMTPSKLLLARTSKKLFLTHTKKSWLNSTPHGAVIAKPLPLITKKPLAEFQRTPTSFWWKWTQLRIKFQVKISKDSQLSNSTRRISQLVLLTTQELEMLTELLNGLRKTPSTNGLSQAMRAQLRLPKNNCDNQYSYLNYS